jgi:tape measure domain-containing protein
MSANGGDIVVQLRMDDGQFRVAVVQSGDLVRALKGKIDQTASSVQNLEKHTQSMGRRFRDLVLTLGNLRFVAMDINDIFLRLPMSILKTAGELEKMQQLMTGLSKETQLAKRQLEGMRDMNFVIGMAKNAPFDIQALSDSFVKLKTAGIDPSNGSMQALVDSVARFGGTGEMLKRASVAIQQMAGKGVISMEELRQQLGEAVPTAMKAMAEGMEMSMADLAKIVSSGTLQAGPALQKMFLRMQIDNAGAAAEMMNTWVGMNAQLKTEWELTAKSIADAGFMNEAKNVVGELTELLRSPEFREFGIAFGQGLGDTVRALSELVGFLMRNREEIVLLGQAWLAYKVITSGIAPLSAAIKKGYEEKTQAMRMMASQISNVGAFERAQAIESAKNAARESAQASAILASKLSAHEKELVSVRAKNTAILAESAKLSAQLVALQNAERLNNANNIGEQQRKLYQIEQLAAATRNLSARDLELRNSIASTSAALQVSTVATATKIAAANTMAATMTRASVATMAATAATKAFGAASAFLGGPIGIAITVIGGLVYWWQKVTNAAKEAEEAQKRAASGATLAGDIELLTNKAKDAAKAVADARAELAKSTTMETVATPMGPATVQRAKTAAERERDGANLARAMAEDKAAYEALQRGKLNLMEQGAEQRANNRMLDLDRELRDMDFGTQQKIAKVKAEKDAYIKANGETSKAAVAEIAKFNREQATILEAGLAQRLERAKQVASAARAAAQAAGLGKEDALQRNLEADKADQRVTDLESRLKGVRDALSTKPQFSSKADKGPKESPFQSLIEGLAADRERLNAEIEGLKEIPGKADKVAGAVAKIEQEIKDGKYGVLSPEQQKKAIEAVRLVADLEKQKDDLEKVAKDYQRVADFIEGQRPQIEEAVELLADPLGTATKGAMEKRAAKFIGSNLTELENYAKKMGLTLDQVKKQITNGAQMGDAANAFAKLEQETAQLNASMVSDSRDAARARAEADNERHRQAMQNIIDERRASGASADEIARLEGILAKNMAARNAKVSQDFKSPMDKLVDNWKNAAKNMEEASVGWANKTMDAMTELVMTGKTDFKSLANSIIADIIRINLQKAAAQAISSATSWLSSVALFADGGIMTESGSMPLKKYASGGIANSPQMAIFGEGSMPEAYVPLPDGRSIPVTMKGGMGGGQHVEINITVHEGGRESSDTKGSEAQNYRQMGERVKSVVREELAAQKRPGGMLYS